MFQSLTTEQLKKLTPSVFTECGAERTSDKYQHISTSRLIDAMSVEGFAVVRGATVKCCVRDAIH